MEKIIELYVIQAGEALAYMLPWIIAISRKHNQRALIFWLNLLFAGLYAPFLWFGLLIWACSDNNEYLHPEKEEYL